MDKARREKLKDALRYLSNVIIIVDQVCDKEEDCVDNYPENLMGSEKFEQMEAAVENLNEAMDKLEDAKECIQSAMAR